MPARYIVYATDTASSFRGSSLTRTMSNFNAAPSALGYYFQVEIALVAFLERGEDESLLSLELLDDIAIETAGSQTEFFQAKANVVKRGSLTDGSEELWKTLRVWSEGASSFPDAVLTLVTHSVAPEHSVAAYLRTDGNRDPAHAHDELVTYARATTSKNLSKARDAFLGLGEEARRALVKRIVVVDGAPGFHDIDDKLARAIRWATRPTTRSLVVERLREWWLRRAEDLLLASADKKFAALTSRELAERISDLEKQLDVDSLPDDFESMVGPTDEQAAASQQKFVMQLRLVSLSNLRIRNAIHDHNRAFAQRARWAREDLLQVGELAAYDRRLKDEWERIWAPETDDESELSEEAAVERGRAVHLHLEKAPLEPIREKVTAPYVGRGSLHLLADELEIGWHPDWVARMQALLVESKA